MEDAHDILRVPIHHSVFQVETFQVADSRRFDLFREAEEAT